MNEMMPNLISSQAFNSRFPINLSRRGFLGASLGALVLGVGLPVRAARAAAAAAPDAMAPGTRVPAFLEIRPDGSVLFQSPFVEGGQGIYTAMAQIVGEELDADPASFTVVSAPPGHDYLVMGGKNRITGGSSSVRTSYDTMRHLGASARQMLLDAAATQLSVPVSELTTEPGKVVHAASSRSVGYGALAAAAAALPIPENVTLRSPDTFRWIKKPVARLDVKEKSTGKAIYTIDVKVDGMLHAAVQHAPRLGQEPGKILNEAEVKAMPGVLSVHRLPGAMAVVAERWWNARRAAEALQMEWTEAAPDTPHAMPADFSTETFRQKLIDTHEPRLDSEMAGDADGAMKSAAKTIEATYDAPYLAHGQLEPPSTIARFNADGTVEVWAPNQAPEMFQAAIAKQTGLPVEKVILHSQMLGGFFGRHFLYMPGGVAFPQAVQLAKETGKPIKLIWSREEEFLRDFHRPMVAVRFRGGLDASGMPVSIQADVIGYGPNHALGVVPPTKVDPNGVEGLVEKPYDIPNRHFVVVPVPQPTVSGYWRSVGHSMNDFIYEGFFDELADAGKQDPYELRLKLTTKSPRHQNLLKQVADLSGGWKRGPYTAEDGSKRARGVALASPFGTETATIAEASLQNGEVVVHHIWVAFDPGSIVNPAIVTAQVQGAAALGLSSALLEEVVYENGMPVARNYDRYPILPLSRMAQVGVRIIESGAKMGGVGEPGLPGVPAAVANAVSALTGRRVRSLPLTRTRFEA